MKVPGHPDHGIQPAASCIFLSTFFGEKNTVSGNDPDVMYHLMPRYFVLFIACISGLLSCTRRSTSPVIARIGKTILTQEDLYRSIPPGYTGRISRDQAVHYVKQWVNTELLYQEALRQKLQKEPEVHARLERVEKDLLAAEMIGRNAGSHNTSVTDSMVARHYEAHKARFVRQKDVVKILELVVPDNKTAQHVLRQATADNIIDIALRYSISPVQDPRTVPYTPIQDLPPAVSVAMASASPGSIAGPLPTTSGYVLLYVFDKQKAGTVCSIEEVRSEIRDILAADLKNGEVDRLLSQLRLIQDVELNLDAIPDPGAAIDSLLERRG